MYKMHSAMCLIKPLFHTTFLLSQGHLFFPNPTWSGFSLTLSAGAFHTRSFVIRMSKLHGLRVQISSFKNKPGHVAVALSKSLLAGWCLGQDGDVPTAGSGRGGEGARKQRVSALQRHLGGTQSNPLLLQTWKRRLGDGRDLTEVFHDAT